MTKAQDLPPPAPLVGVWLVGARGAIATSVACGLLGLRSGAVAPVGLVSESEPFRQLSLLAPSALVLGGSEVRGGTLREAASELESARVLPAGLAASLAAQLDEIDGRIRPGFADGAPPGGDGAFAREVERLTALSPREQIRHLAAELRAFSASLGGAPVVVVNVASTEAWRPASPDWEQLERFDRAIDRGERPPASCLVAYAAFEAGAGYVNFTPSLGASSGALLALARQRACAHAGRDGKTGETLIKTTLAPMFAARHLKVLAWQGYNMLGNRDGEVLSDPAHKRAKVESKDEAVRSLLGHPDLTTHVAIDFVPSLGDWKTAMDYVHFEGFFGCRMSLSFTWHGSDSALAAPLVIDLVRFWELAQRRGEVGELSALAPFFKSPLGATTHDFGAQHRAFLAWALS